MFARVDAKGKFQFVVWICFSWFVSTAETSHSAIDGRYNMVLRVRTLALDGSARSATAATISTPFSLP